MVNCAYTKNKEYLYDKDEMLMTIIMQGRELTRPSKKNIDSAGACTTLWRRQECLLTCKE